MTDPSKEKLEISAKFSKNLSNAPQGTGTDLLGFCRTMRSSNAHQEDVSSSLTGFDNVTVLLREETLIQHVREDSEPPESAHLLFIVNLRGI